MRISHIATYLALAASTVSAASIPNSDAVNVREEVVSVRSSDVLAPEHVLEKRKGGGGKGGGSLGGGSSSSGSSGGSGGSRTSSGSNVGGRTSAGSGPPRAFGGGGYYGGGASVPYGAGQKSGRGIGPGVLIAPVLLIGLLPGLWLYSVYPYHFSNPYRFTNQSDTNSTNPNGTNTTLPVTCLCEQYSSCGCDENDDQKYLNDLVGNGSYDALNKTLVNVADVNGTRTLVINGTLPNGTTAPGGQDDAGIALALPKFTGYYALGMTVFYFCMFA
ncbi:hypothetical protein BU23DRAFT_544172 [Bimuria novae-zelandiae CBS 107.79]|uniref:DUF7732 domain-containing protein n=1 Tax=Bimuria novae-zelandiae CBS 107.79 TaxID=1447943 RepID=A0A6A5UPA3_9PLEO|nr:hypothetical protein BU23DRAFT_544172 [Bimuria novae-zelandiae CBS 107.79]